MQIEEDGFQKFIAETGFDPRRDLSEILVVTNGKTDQNHILVLGKGVFNPAKIMTMAQTQGAGVTNYNGVDLLAHPGKENTALAFLDASTALMGGADAVKAAIDRRKQGAPLPSDVLARVRQLSTDNDAWFMTTGPLSDFFAGKIADPNLSGAMQGNLLQAVLQASGGIKFGQDAIRISGEALTRSEKDATALADVVRFIAGLVQLNKDGNEQAQKIASLLDTMQLTTQASTMKLSLTIPEDLMEKLFVPQDQGPRQAGKRKRASIQ
jgi:hypothetical protein